MVNSGYGIVLVRMEVEVIEQSGKLGYWVAFGLVVAIALAGFGAWIYGVELEIR